MYLDVTAAGSIKFNFPDREPEEMPFDKSCALDMAEAGGMTLDDVAETMNMTRERVRQLEELALWRIGQRKQLRAAGVPIRADPRVVLEKGLTPPPKEEGET